jgi:hypothetical protein
MTIRTMAIVYEDAIPPDGVAVQIRYLEIIHVPAEGAMPKLLHRQNSAVSQQQLIANVQISRIDPPSGCRGSAL